MDNQLQFNPGIQQPVLADDDKSSSKFFSVKSNPSNASQYSELLSAKKISDGGDSRLVIYDSSEDDEVKKRKVSNTPNKRVHSNTLLFSTVS